MADGRTDDPSKLVATYPEQPSGAVEGLGLLRIIFPVPGYVREGAGDE